MQQFTQKDLNFIKETLSLARQTRDIENTLSRAFDSANPKLALAHLSESELKFCANVLDNRAEIYLVEKELLKMLSTEQTLLSKSTSGNGVQSAMPVFKINSDGMVKAYKDGKGVRRFSVTASSDADDLAGDFFEEKALKRMESTAKGMTMFLNHSYDVPDDVFGSVEKATLERKSAFNRILGKYSEYLCLNYEGIVTEVNPKAVETHKMMMEGVVKLGASVSVLILEKSNTKDGRRAIEDVINLECSIVGLPCNPTSWVESASKALKVA